MFCASPHEAIKASSLPCCGAGHTKCPQHVWDNVCSKRQDRPAFMSPETMITGQQPLPAVTAQQCMFTTERQGTLHTCSDNPEIIIISQRLHFMPRHDSLAMPRTAHTNIMHTWHMLMQQHPTCSEEPEIMIIGQQLMPACDSPAMPCTAPGPDTVSRAPGTPVR